MLRTVPLPSFCPSTRSSASSWGRVTLMRELTLSVADVADWSGPRSRAWLAVADAMEIAKARHRTRAMVIGAPCGTKGNYPTKAHPLAPLAKHEFSSRDGMSLLYNSRDSDFLENGEGGEGGGGGGGGGAGWRGGVWGERRGGGGEEWMEGVRGGGVMVGGGSGGG